MKIAADHSFELPGITDENRLYFETLFTVGGALIASSVLRALEKTVPLSSAILAGAQVILNNRVDKERIRVDQQNWLQFTVVRFGTGLSVMTGKVLFDVLAYGETNDNYGSMITAAAVNTASGLIFRYMTKD